MRCIVAANLAALSNYALSQRLPQLDPAGPREYGNQWFNPADAVAPNPQPLPLKQLPSKLSLGDAISLSPQPLPPRYLLQNSYINPGRLIELNSQPLAPDPSDPELNLWDHSAVLTVLKPQTDMSWFTGATAYRQPTRPPIF